MFQVLRIRDFRLLWSARVVSSLGSWFLVIAVPAHVFQLTGSLLASGLTLAAEFFPVLLLGQIGGVFADRWDRRTVMVIADLFRALAIGLLFLVRSPDQIWIVYLALAAESTGSLFFRPASQAHTPVVVGTGKDLTAANSLNAFTEGTMRLIGAPLGAAILVVFGFNAVVIIDVSSYLISGATILLMARTTTQSRDTPVSLRQISTDFKEGIKALWQQPIARALLPITVIFLASNASLSALLVPFGITHWGGREQVGLVVSALGIGFLLGAPLLRYLADRMQPRILLSIALAVTSGGFFLLFDSNTLIPALAAAVVIGLSGSMVLVIPQTTLQRVIPNEVLGRVSAVFLGGEATATMIGALAGPTIAQRSGVMTITLAACTAVIVASALCLAIMPRVAAEPTAEASLAT